MADDWFGDWFSFYHELPDRPEVIGLENRTKVELALILGRLCLLWRHADHRTTDGFLLNMTPQSCGRRFGGDEQFWLAVAEVGWLEFTDKGAQVPDFQKRFGESAKRRMMNARQKKQKRRESPDADPEEADDADTLRTPCGHDADTLRTSCGHDADNLRTSCGQVADQQSESQSQPESEGRVETSRVDHLVSWKKKFTNDVVSFCTRTFCPERDPVFFRGSLKRRDWELLLKVGALCVDGQVPEAAIRGALDAIRYHTGKPITSRMAYFRTVLSDELRQRAKGSANGNAESLNRLLIGVKIPDELLVTHPPARASPHERRSG